MATEAPNEGLPQDLPPAVKEDSHAEGLPQDPPPAVPEDSNAEGLLQESKEPKEPPAKKVKKSYVTASLPSL